MIEFERLQQLTDPLLLAGRSQLAALEPSCANRAIMVCSLYRDRVLCVLHVGAESIQVGRRRIPILRGRGMPMPLFRGAGSKAILAWLAPHRLRALYAVNASAIAAARLGADAAAFRRTLSAIRRAGHAYSHGELRPGIDGYAAPILLPDRGVIGSVLLLDAETLPAAERTRWLAVLRDRAAAIAAEVEQRTEPATPSARTRSARKARAATTASDRASGRPAPPAATT
ncbi:MAG: IclR family transcriptional regulator C-terminal domain-containing protein, partial [Lautropia sp.]